MRSPRGLLPCLLTHFYFALAFKGVTFSATCDAFSQGKTVARFEKCHSFVIDDDGGRQALDGADRLFGVADRLVDLIVDRRILARVDRLRDAVDRRLHAGRVQLSR